ncbi:hypothetical protein R1flu_003824 [Riccia fluitans]|uniref:Beta-lactamase-related domain-containing protein n=1 Tax=Riccia fluitans TaxID=41844 RepID=A0ABD1YB31_9MARC
MDDCVIRQVVAFSDVRCSWKFDLPEWLGGEGRRRGEKIRSWMMKHSLPMLIASGVLSRMFGGRVGLTQALCNLFEPPTISEIMFKAIADRAFPGGAVAFGSCTVPYYYRAYGTYTFESIVEVTPESLWDMASLTKIMVTTPCIMLLYDRGLIELEEVACKYLPEFGNNGKELVTIHQLLTHTAGLREFYPFFDMGVKSRKQVLDYILNDRLWYTSGEMARYSDLSMIVLGIIVERVTGSSLDAFAAEEIFRPLGMQHTTFRPIDLTDFDVMVVPTEVDRLHRNRLLWGEVHDPTAFLLGGVAGHAGLFSSIVDVCRVMLAGGIDLLTNRRLFKEATVRLFITPDLKTASNPRPFALGWDVSLRRALDGYTSAGQYLGPRTFGHTGFTGTSLWIDPDRDLFVTLLTNAVHPSATVGFGSKVRAVRPLIADAAVYTMEQQSMPRGTLRWHLGSGLGDKSCESLVHPAYQAHTDAILSIRDCPPDSAELGRQTLVGKASALPREEPSKSTTYVYSDQTVVASFRDSKDMVPKKKGVQVLLTVFVFSLVVSLMP